MAMPLINRITHPHKIEAAPISALAQRGRDIKSQGEASAIDA